ncbi:MAG: pilus (MSHA type) biogenesis protein MshL [Magnetococcales bacterium]|nr:pilus (MSHA type) biogenesis protein MshL [Magnetococcales bacterium]
MKLGRKQNRWLTLVAVLLLTTSCASNQEEGGSEFQAIYDAMMENTTPITGSDEASRNGGTSLSEVEGGVPENVSMALLDLELLDKIPTPPVEPRFDILVDKAPAREFFQSLVTDDPRLNMVLHPNLEGEISLELNNVTVFETVEAVCEMYGYDCQPFAAGGSGTFRGFKVYPSSRLVTRTFRVDFLPLKRGGHTQTSVNSGNMSVTSQSTNADGSSSSSDSNSPGSDVTTDYEADLWGDLESAIRAFLGMDDAWQADSSSRIEGQENSSRDRNESIVKESESRSTYKRTVDSDVTIRRVMVNKQAGLIVVRALPQEIRDIEGYLSQLRARSQRQVILEAKILEVELSDGFQFGVDWLAINKGIGSDRLGPLQSEPNDGTTFLETLDESDESAVMEWSQGVILSKTVAEPFSLAFREHDFIGFINLLQQQGKVQVLSSPRVATINNQKAVIKVGEDEIFMSDMELESETTSTGTQDTLNPVFKTYFSGVALDVTPQVGEDDWITLHVHPTVNEVEDRIKTIDMGDKIYNLPLAFSKSREADSIIRVRNGEVAVIGGLMKRELEDNSDSLPFLGSIPYLGTLFSHTEKVWKKNELVILIRPVIVGESGDWRKQVTETAKRIQEMKPETASMDWIR